MQLLLKLLVLILKLFELTGDLSKLLLEPVDADCEIAVALHILLRIGLLLLLAVAERELRERGACCEQTCGEGERDNFAC